MANGHGGKRTPASPAPVSGPGSLSRRTDGGPQQTLQKMTGLPYGENGDFNAMQSAAPLSASPTALSPEGQALQEQTIGKQAAAALFSPTNRPDEPVTAGAPFGPGPGPQGAPGMSAINGNDARLLSKYLPGLMAQAENVDAPEGFRRFVRHLRNVSAGA